MKRLDKIYRQAGADRRLVLNIFMTIGYPTLDESLALARTALAAGADVLELGVPFSDPVAEGPTIQQSSQIALSNGVRMDDCLKFARTLRDESDAGLLLMGYANPFFSYGPQRLAAAARTAGLDGFIVADLPDEEADPLAVPVKDNGLLFVQFLSPTTGPRRSARLVSRGSGFIYCVALTGVTGAREAQDSGLDGFLRKARRLTTRPLAVGFGISTPKHIRDLHGLADGVIVGSAFIEICQGPDEAKRLRRAGQFVSRLAAACKDEK